MDGTEEVYNRSKAYIHKDGSAYQIVKKNISHVLEAEILLMIRMNVNLKNAENLKLLVDEFGSEFSGDPNLQMYIFPIFDKQNWEDRYTHEEWIDLYDTLFAIQDKILDYNIAVTALSELPKRPRYYHCMADSPNSLVITPEGNIGLCDHYSENGFIGHISSPGYDEKMAATWREQSDRIPLCDTCPIYPDCIFLKRCAGATGCFEHMQRHKCRVLIRTMHKEYERWLHNH